MHILEAFVYLDSDHNDLIPSQTHISSPSLPVLLSSSVQSIQTTLESVIPAMDMDTTGMSAFPEQQDEGPDGGQLHDSHILGYLIKKTGEVTERLPLLKDWSVRKTIILVTIFIVLYQLCTTLIHALQVDHIV